MEAICFIKKKKANCFSWWRHLCVCPIVGHM